MAEKLESTTPPIQAEYNPERKLTKKEIDKLPPEEKQRVLDSMAPEDFIPAGYGVDDIAFSNAVYKKLGFNPEEMESLRKARLSEYKEQQKKRDKPIKESTKIDKIFEAGGPKAGDVLNVSENGKVKQYYILENDGKNMVFTIGKDGARQPIGLRQAKEFLSKPGISFTFEEKKKKRVHTQNEKRDKNSKQDEEIIVPANLNPEKPNGEQAPDIEIKDAEAKLKLEIAELEQEIAELEIQEQELLQKNTKKTDEIINSQPEATFEENKTQEIVSETVSIEEFQKDINRIVRNNLGEAFEDNGLDYEKTVVKYEHNIIHTEIGFNDHKILLCFDLTSVNGETVLANDHWVQTSWHKIITLNKLNDKNAKSWCDIIMSKFIEDKSPKQNFHKLALDNGNLVIEKKI